ncbi:hypothetical protein, variant [Blastomyces dermatitidis ER-3]|uniref:Uncharacterized protein n=1 Tax=Ajellomyces dermatitidis (strain ER-3 / ATCC MYA-2586) TaxID=559297 RepID=A0ABX2VYC8_AJEDR|nr:uncharacterized protein BDCG_17418 [Blastomyces dermatitidis ER-3]XP_045281885.1 hypothetical protein, variant [Blastomyces dermatitidis ER-3]OAT02157.1 hypothetical protein BDCG_17418 [Blastomyces dermatitidis ER-3]OAT02158.1 hypothetical protein, variant [Blastomyces dermatitidis ER-3]
MEIGAILRGSLLEYPKFSPTPRGSDKCCQSQFSILPGKNDQQLRDSLLHAPTGQYLPEADAAPDSMGLVSAQLTLTPNGKIGLAIIRSEQFERLKTFLPCILITTAEIIIARKRTICGGNAERISWCIFFSPHIHPSGLFTLHAR